MEIKREYLAEIQRWVSKTEAAVEAIKSAQSRMDLRDSWENFLGYFSKALGKMITAAQKEKVSKTWGHVLRNQYQKDDPGLVFLREARNVAEHGLEPFADFEDPKTIVGEGGIALVGSCTNIRIQNCSFNGVPSGNFTVSTENGKITKIKGAPNPHLPIEEKNAEIRLVTVINPEKKNQEYPVPKSLNGKDIEMKRPLSLAQAAADFLEMKLNELKVKWGCN